jgi:hypothetical protein
MEGTTRKLKSYKGFERNIDATVALRGARAWALSQGLEPFSFAVVVSELKL